ncbi:hypothetical protein NicSoilE8_26100 [Arthrobacter sp. NicSoilE8]|nr:hypothetical protein NicSoilE8_26100 [Arthrobacter sp. NicSoilE8]
MYLPSPPPDLDLLLGVTTPGSASGTSTSVVICYLRFLLWFSGVWLERLPGFEEKVAQQRGRDTG